uniref:S100P-binding protein n=1 Tax=Corvus moneduloides TaxID=1196302 RepID=A0A8C3ES18_CORMO
ALCSLQGSSSFAHFSVSKYNDVAISLDISRCFDNSELDDSLLELSGSEKGNSPFDYTEEEIQEILADDSVDAEQQHLAGESHLSQNASGESGKAESGKAESSSCTAGTSVSEAASEVTEEPKEAQEHPSGSSGCDPGFLSGSAALDGAQLQQELDFDLQELLSLFAATCSDEALEDNYLGEVEALEAMIDDCLNSTAAGSCIPKESSEGVMPKGQQSLAQDCSGQSVPSSDLPHGQSKGDESPASVLPSNKELAKATTSCSSRKSDSPESAEGESTGAEQPSGSTKVNSRLNSCNLNGFSPIPLDLCSWPCPCAHKCCVYTGEVLPSGFLCNCISKTYMEKFNYTLIPFPLPFPVSCRPDWAGRDNQWEEK